MKYQSKKDPNIMAVFDYKDEVRGINRLIYLTGEKAGHSFEVSSSTLKRWWNEIPTTPEEDEEAIINAPYHPDVTPHYIPKPESVVQYEKARSRRKPNTCEFELPEGYEEFANLLESFGANIRRVNKEYITLEDGSKFKLRQSGIAILASTDMAEIFSKHGFKAKACIEKSTPFRFDIGTNAEYDTMKDILKSL